MVRKVIICAAVIMSTLVLNAQNRRRQQEPNDIHRQAVSSNFGLRRPQDASELPWSKADIVWPQRTPKQTPAPVLNPVLDNKWELQGGWELSEDQSLWYDATVPGTVLTTLVQQGVYPDPYFGVNNLVIPDDLCRKDWWYRTEFSLTAEQLAKESIELLFDGINYRADVLLNGVKLGDIKGAFIRGKFQIKGLAAENNLLTVHIYPPYNPGIPHEESSKAGQGPNGGQLCLDGPTFISSEGWDWVPGVRDRNIGIWQPVYVKVSDGITIGDTRVVTDLPLPDVSSADVTVETSIANALKDDRDVVLKVCLDGRTIEKPVTVPAQSSVRVSLTSDEYSQLHLTDPKLWWPNGYGEQNLYTMDLCCIASGSVSDVQKVSFGVRELSYEFTVDTPSKKGARIEYNPTALRGNTDIFNNRHQRDVGNGVSVPGLREGVDESVLNFIEPDDMAPYLVIKVNGVRIFCKGGNWGMDDMMKCTTREHLEPYLKLHKEAGFTMVRNWTGESTEEMFYQLCDEYGMLVWNDFWLSTEGYNLDVNDEPLFMANATDAVRRFRNHPSIAVWCPRNEGYATESLEKDITAMLCAEDGTRHYHPNSRNCDLKPSGPWHYFADASEYYTQQAKGFNTELGTPSVPTANSIRKFMAPEDQWPLSEVWNYHDLHPSTAGYLAAISGLYGEGLSLDDFCKKAQIINFDSHRAMFEAWNSHLWHNTSGVLLWMSHPAWPSTVWQTYSWDYETNGSWFGCRKACEPLHIQMNLDDFSIVVINTTREDQAGLKAEVCFWTLDGKLLSSKSEKLALAAADCLTPAFKAELPKYDGVYIARTRLLRGSEVISENDYIRKGEGVKDFTALNSLAGSSLKISSVKKAGIDPDGCKVVTFTIANTAKVAAVSVKLDLVDAASGEQILPAYFSDGYFNLLPGQRKTVTVKYNGTDNISFKAESYNPVSVTVK